MAGEDGGISDVLGDECLTEAIGAKEDAVAGFLDEVESQGVLDDSAINVARPVPVEVGDEFEAAESSKTETAVKAAPGAVEGFGADDLFEQSVRRPTASSGAG